MGQLTFQWDSAVHNAGFTTCGHHQCVPSFQAVIADCHMKQRIGCQFDHAGDGLAAIIPSKRAVPGIILGRTHDKPSDAKRDKNQRGCDFQEIAKGFGDR